MVDGIYNKDPNKYPDAVKYTNLTHDEVLQSNLQVMDATAAALCRDKGEDSSILNEDPENIVRIIEREFRTLVE